MNIRKTATSTLNLSAGANQLQVDLGATASANIIQSISVVFKTSSTSLTDVSSWNIKTSDGGANSNLFYSSQGVVQSFTQIGRNLSIVSLYRYLSLNVNCTVGTGISVTVVVSYLQIPSTNSLYNSFLISSGTTNTALTTLLNGPMQGSYVIKSVWLTINDSTSVSPGIYLVQNSVFGEVDRATISGVSGSISSAGLVSSSILNLSLSPGTSLNMTQVGTNNFTYYVSYTYNALDV